MNNSGLIPADSQLWQRASISLAFVINGINVGIWSVMVPVLIINLSIAETDIGVMILIGGVFSIGALYGAGHLVARFGSRNVTLISTAIIAPGFLFLFLSPSFPIAVVAFIWLFSSLSIMDIAMNANAADFERNWDRSAMSSFHGFWSLGAMIGAAAGGYCIDQFGTLTLTILSGVVSIGSLLVLVQGLAVDDMEQTEKDGSSPIFELPKRAIVYVFGALALLSFVTEGAIYDWGAVFMRNELNVDATRSGWGLAAFSAAATLPGLQKGVAISTVTMCGYAGILVAPALLGWVGEALGFAAVFLGFVMPLVALVPLAITLRRRGHI